MNVGKHSLFALTIVDSYYRKRGNILLVFNIICISLKTERSYTKKSFVKFDSICCYGNHKIINGIIRTCFLVTGGLSIDIPMQCVIKYYLAFNNFQEHLAYNFVTHL